MLSKARTIVRASVLRHVSCNAVLKRTMPGLKRDMSGKPTIYYTETDEAPALATYSLLPVIKQYTAKVGIAVEKPDISLAGRLLATFSDRLKPDQKIPDELSKLGEIAKTPEANIIKLPNISASVPQLHECIAELREKGYDVPLYVQDAKTPEEIANKELYSKVLGSAVNPVLREGNSDRRVAAPVKAYAQKNPHKMGAWSSASKTHVAHMKKGDFYESEQSATMQGAGSVKIELIGSDGSTTVLKPEVKLQDKEVFDAACMRVAELREFLEKEMQDAKKQDVLFSLHLKATMMKVSDPVMFGHCVTVFYKSVFEKHSALFKKLGVNENNGLGDVYERIEKASEAEKKAVLADIEKVYEERPWLAMVNSDLGITNLHIPSDVIVDASMPCVVRDSGKMWNKENELEDTKCVIPDRCYATMYQEMINFCKKNGQFDVATMGNVANVGLMAQKAEEYGSHDKTFVIPKAGTVKVSDTAGKVYFEHKVAEGDIWRMCQTKDAPIKDWVKLAVSRARATGNPAIFWLDAMRAHDRQIIDKVKEYLPLHDTSGLTVEIMTPVDAMRLSCERAKAGKDTISVTGNVLRDYLTDLFPILELGTSAKMLSIVPLLAGGGLFETGAGGSAPKHVEQFLKESHLRWDSLGEYLATAVSLERLGELTGDQRTKNLGEALNKATGRVLDHRKSPSRKVNEIDNRASNFYIALYWAKFMGEFEPQFHELYEKLKKARPAIVEEFKNCQGPKADVGGYYKFDDAKATVAMRPSKTFNEILDSF